MTRLPEVISTVRRRRAWSDEEKVAILHAAFRPGGSVAAAADRFDVSRALIYRWRKQVRAGLMPGVTLNEAGAAAFAAVAVVADVPAHVAPASAIRVGTSLSGSKSRGSPGPGSRPNFLTKAARCSSSAWRSSGGILILGTIRHPSICEAT
jgi:transposase